MQWTAVKRVVIATCLGDIAEDRASFRHIFIPPRVVRGRRRRSEGERRLIASRLRLNLSPGCNGRARAHGGSSGFNKRLLATKLLVVRSSAPCKEEVPECHRPACIPQRGLFVSFYNRGFCSRRCWRTPCQSRNKCEEPTSFTITRIFANGEAVASQPLANLRGIYR